MSGRCRRRILESNHPVGKLITGQAIRPFRLRRVIAGLEVLIEQRCIVPNVLFEIAAGIFLNQAVRQLVKFFFRVQTQPYEVQESC